MEWYKELLIEPLCLIGILIVLVCIGIILLKYKLFTKKFWIIVDLVSLTLASIGIFGMLASNRIFFYKVETKQIEYKIQALSSWLDQRFNTEIYNREFILTESSPQDIDVIQEDFNSIHSWILTYRDTILKTIGKSEYIDIRTIEYPDINSSNCKHLNEEIKYIKELLIEYNNLVSLRQSYINKCFENNFEILYQIFSPFFIMLSLAFQFIRCIWEFKRIK